MRDLFQGRLFPDALSGGLSKFCCYSSDLIVQDSPGQGEGFIEHHQIEKARILNQDTDFQDVCKALFNFQQGQVG